MKKWFIFTALLLCIKPNAQLIANRAEQKDDLEFLISCLGCQKRDLATIFSKTNFKKTEEFQDIIKYTKRSLIGNLYYVFTFKNNRCITIMANTHEALYGDYVRLFSQHFPNADVVKRSYNVTSIHANGEGLDFVIRKTGYNEAEIILGVLQQDYNKFFTFTEKYWPKLLSNIYEEKIKHQQKKEHDIELQNQTHTFAQTSPESQELIHYIQENFFNESTHQSWLLLSFKKISTELSRNYKRNETANFTLDVTLSLNSQKRPFNQNDIQLSINTDIKEENRITINKSTLSNSINKYLMAILINKVKVHRINNVPIPTLYKLPSISLTFRQPIAVYCRVNKKNELKTKTLNCSKKDIIKYKSLLKENAVQFKGVERLIWIYSFELDNKEYSYIK